MTQKAVDLSKVRKAAQPAFIEPMLATLTDERFSRRGWLFEPKFDGVRCVVIRRERKIELYSRNRKLLNAKYPELVEAFQEQQAGPFIIDGEIVAFDGEVTSFTRLQQRMQVQNPSAELRRKFPVSFYAFDLPYAQSYDLRPLPLRDRKELLKTTVKFEKPLHFTHHRETEGEAYYREACERHWEGIIAKNADSPYVSGRSRDWLKFKCINEQEFVLGGYTDPQGQRTGFGALLVGYYDRKKLKYAGKVGTGYDNLTLQRLGARLAGMRTSSSPFEENGAPRSAHWVKPKLVAQIGFTEWTKDGKLRHPRFLGLRDDKKPEEVTREK